MAFRLFKRFLSNKNAQLIGGAFATMGFAYYIQEGQLQPQCLEKIDPKLVPASDKSKDPANFNHLKNEYFFRFAAHVLPHPDKVAKGGEDAYFAEHNLLCVADGVGGWAEYGVDPAEYSRALVANVEKNYKQHILKYIQNPKELLIKAASETDILGSSTLVLVTVDKNKNILKTSYIGDSGYCLYRVDGENSPHLVFGFKEQQKSFNFPYQLGSKGNGDSPTTALEFSHEIQEKDIIVVGSDGLFDNMDFEQIRKIVHAHISNNKQADVQQLAKTIGDQAKKYSLQRFYDSPFAQKARQANLNYRGGKSDDITVVVAQIERFGGI